jgi:hypothetical protein
VTVKELIQALEDYPGDATVMTVDAKCHCGEYEDVEAGMLYGVEGKKGNKVWVR